MFIFQKCGILKLISVSSSPPWDLTLFTSSLASLWVLVCSIIFSVCTFLTDDQQCTPFPSWLSALPFDILSFICSYHSCAVWMLAGLSARLHPTQLTWLAQTHSVSSSSVSNTSDPTTGPRLSPETLLAPSFRWVSYLFERKISSDRYAMNRNPTAMWDSTILIPRRSVQTALTRSNGIQRMTATFYLSFFMYLGCEVAPRIYIPYCNTQLCMDQICL